MSGRKRTHKSAKKDHDKLHSSAKTTSPSAPPKENDTPAERFPMLSYRRILARLVIVFATMLAARFLFGPQQPVIAKVSETVDHRFMDMACSTDYRKDRVMFKECAPTNKCGRGVIDGLVSGSEARDLLRIAKTGLALGGSNGGASILDLHSGALSKGDKFINIYSTVGEDNPVFSEADFKLYRRIRSRIESTIANEFGIPERVIYLTKPTFFSRMTSRPAKTVHDEYWHAHIDKETYGSFDYTSLLYLSNYDSDFKGGRFVFIDKDTNRTVEPKMGRLSFFTSGSENLHHVEKVTSGVRYALTVSFTCDPMKAISDPSLKRAQS